MMCPARPLYLTGHRGRGRERERRGHLQASKHTNIHLTKQDEGVSGLRKTSECDAWLTCVGPLDGARVGAPAGILVGVCVGAVLGKVVGRLVGPWLGKTVGPWLGRTVGPWFGTVVGVCDQR
jgi:tetrahydromethanopterin S-methyltransferase subunit G